VILRSGDGSVSLLVDRVGEVLELDDDDFECPPEVMRGRLRDVVRGLYKRDGALLLALNTTTILNEMEQAPNIGGLR
jgi:purine-binding chemotaxis protein CheW